MKPYVEIEAYYLETMPPMLVASDNRLIGRKSFDFERTHRILDIIAKALTKINSEQSRLASIALWQQVPNVVWC